MLLLFCACLALELLLVLLDLTVNWWRYSDSPAIRRMFNITREDGIATLFAVIQTFALALTCWIIFWLTRKTTPASRASTGWLILAIFFTYMGIDDGALVHERLGTAFKHSVGDRPLPTYGWQIVVGPVFVIFGLFLLIFLWTRSRLILDRFLLIAGLGCLGTAVLIDLIEGSPHGYRIIADLSGIDEKTFSHFAKSFEEFIEMFGITLLWMRVLRHLFALAATLTILWDRGRLTVRSEASQAAPTDGKPASAIATSSSL